MARGLRKKRYKATGRGGYSCTSVRIKREVMNQSHVAVGGQLPALRRRV